MLKRGRNVKRFIVGVGAAALLATAATSVDAGGPSRPNKAASTTIAAYAVEHHLTGLSPASLQPVTTRSGGLEPSQQQAQADRAGAAAYAGEHHLTGLSPAALHPIGR